MYFVATVMSPFWLERKSKPGPLSPPASSNPLMPGGMKCVPTGPTNLPPRALRAASRSNAARIALRTLMLSSGLMVMFSGNQRKPPDGTVLSWSLLCRTTRLSTCAGGDGLGVVFGGQAEALEPLRRGVRVERQARAVEHLAAGDVRVGRVRAE